jgi:nucleotide-binding universal stress UspA family protein
MLPPRSLLAAIDFSEGSRAALTAAARLAAHCGAPLHVLHVEDPLLRAAAAHHGFDLSDQTREELQRFADTARPTAGGRTTLHVRAGSPAPLVAETARAEGADVIVIGSRGMSGLERFVFGSTAERVLRDADRPVLVVPPGWVPASPDGTDLRGTGPLMAAIDFSDVSPVVAGAAAALAGALGTTLELLHVVPELSVLQRWQPHADAAVAERVDAARQDLAALAARVSVPGVDTRVERGHVAQTIAAAAAPAGARQPWIVMGKRSGRTHGVGPGTTAYRVLAQTAVPVLVCPGPD